MANNVKVAWIYAPEDKKIAWEVIKGSAALDFRGHLDYWYIDNIAVGRNWRDEVRRNLLSASVIVLMISKDLFADETGLWRYTISVRKDKLNGFLVPILLRDTLLPPDLRSLTLLPRNHRPLFSHEDVDAAIVDVVRELGAVIQRAHENMERDFDNQDIFEESCASWDSNEDMLHVCSDLDLGYSKEKHYWKIVTIVVIFLSIICGLIIFDLNKSSALPTVEISVPTKKEEPVKTPFRGDDEKLSGALSKPNPQKDSKRALTEEKLYNISEDSPLMVDEVVVTVKFGHEGSATYATIQIIVEGKPTITEAALGPGCQIPFEVKNENRMLIVVRWDPEHGELFFLIKTKSS